MTILSARELRRSYGATQVLSGATLSLDAGQRAGVVGRNGSGKSTLARLLARVEDPDDGELVWSRGLRVLYLAQEPEFIAGRTILDTVLEGKSEWTRAMARHEAVSASLVEGVDHTRVDQLLHEQSEAAAEVEKLGGWDLRHEAEAMLDHLEVAEHTRPLDRLSGGERRRVALARLFVARPDLAIIDEPTNHLDLATVEWLEGYLRDSFGGALILVTHDRYLLDRVVDRTYEVADGSVFTYEGGWERYLVAKAERQAHAARVDANRQNYLRRELEWLRRQPKARTGKSKARVDRVNASLADVRGSERGRAVFEVGGTRSGRTILDIRGLGVARGEKTLVSGLDLSLQSGQRLGIVGPNGCGKTSLLSCLLGELPPAAGTLRWGKNTRTAYLDQERSGLEPEDTVYDAVAQGRSVVELGGHTMAVRTYLERFLFDTDAQQQRVRTLSGGERGRVALATALRDAANLVVLDEPTNDLDVDTLAALEEALLEFGGTVLAVTHDRWFLDRVATGIVAFEGDAKLGIYAGNYTHYLQQRPPPAGSRPEAAGVEVQPPTVARARPTPQTDPNKARLTYAERKELSSLMGKIEAAEASVVELEAELEKPEFYRRPHAEQREFLARVDDGRREVERLTRRWEALEVRSE